MLKRLCIIMSLTVLLVSVCVPVNVTANSWVLSTEEPMYEYQSIDDESCVFRVAQTQSIQTDTFYVPDTIDGYKVTSMYPFAYQMSGITAVNMVVPDAVKSIGEYAFDTSIENLYLPEGLETISFHVMFTDTMKEIVIPTTVTSIEPYAFGWYASAQEGLLGGSEKVEDFTVYSYGNDVARAYAEADGHRYVDLSEYALGDMDLDNAVTMKDVMTLYQMGAGQAFGSPVHHVMGDYVRDNTVDMIDVMTLYKATSGNTAL